MAQNITLMGASYPDVPSVLLPKTGGGTATFTDVGDTTATAADVAQGTYFYTAAGVRTAGTASGGGTGGITQDAQGYLVLDDEGGGGGGGTGLVYESGTYTPTTDVAHPAISFAGSHTAAPAFACIADVGSTVTDADSAIWWELANFNSALGQGIITTTTNTFNYGVVRYAYRTSGVSSSGTSIGSLDGATNSSLSYWASASSFSPYVGSDTRYFRSGRTYKWIAVWAPTS